jgi:hypothetical protein
MFVESLSTSLLSCQFHPFVNVHCSNSLSAGHYSLCGLRVATGLRTESAPSENNNLHEPFPQCLPPDADTTGTVRTAACHRSGSSVSCTRRTRCWWIFFATRAAVMVFPSCPCRRQASAGHSTTEKYGTCLLLVLRAPCCASSSSGQKSVGKCGIGGFSQERVRLACTQLPDRERVSVLAPRQAGGRVPPVGRVAV